MFTNRPSEYCSPSKVCGNSKKVLIFLKEFLAVIGMLFMCVPPTTVVPSPIRAFMPWSISSKPNQSKSLVPKDSPNICSSSFLSRYKPTPMVISSSMLSFSSSTLSPVSTNTSSLSKSAMSVMVFKIPPTVSFNPARLIINLIKAILIAKPILPLPKAIASSAPFKPWSSPILVTKDSIAFWTALKSSPNASTIIP